MKALPTEQQVLTDSIAFLKTTDELGAAQLVGSLLLLGQQCSDELRWVINTTAPKAMAVELDLLLGTLRRAARFQGRVAASLTEWALTDFSFTRPLRGFPPDRGLERAAERAVRRAKHGLGTFRRPRRRPPPGLAEATGLCQTCWPDAAGGRPVGQLALGCPGRSAGPQRAVPLGTAVAAGVALDFAVFAGRAFRVAKNCSACAPCCCCWTTRAR